jgi:hypothetical protein
MIENSIISLLSHMDKLKVVQDEQKICMTHWFYTHHIHHLYIICWALYTYICEKKLNDDHPFCCGWWCLKQSVTDERLHIIKYITKNIVLKECNLYTTDCIQPSTIIINHSSFVMQRTLYIVPISTRTHIHNHTLAHNHFDQLRSFYIAQNHFALWRFVVLLQNCSVVSCRVVRERLVLNFLNRFHFCVCACVVLHFNIALLSTSLAA